jgi:hypothetical protein
MCIVRLPHHITDGRIYLMNTPLYPVHQRVFLNSNSFNLSASTMILSLLTIADPVQALFPFLLFNKRDVTEQSA